MWCSVLLFAISIATCHFGVSYEESKIPPEIRENMSDTDWIGIKWILRGMLILLLSVISMIIAATILGVQQWKGKKR